MIVEKEKPVFYTYLRGLVVFLLWIVNGNAHYHNKDKILDKSENYILEPLSPNNYVEDTYYTKNHNRSAAVKQM